MSTMKLAIVVQNPNATIDTARATVDRATQYLRRYFDVDESEIAPGEPLNWPLDIPNRERTY